MESYTGTLLHSAAYNRSFDATGKNVAVIGSGSSSIQIVPTLQPKAAHLTAHLRSNTWITPSISQNLLRRHPDGTLDTSYSPEQIENFKKDFNALIQHRQDLEGGISEGCKSGLGSPCAHLLMSFLPYLSPPFPQRTPFTRQDAQTRYQSDEGAVAAKA